MSAPFFPRHTDSTLATRWRAASLRRASLCDAPATKWAWRAQPKAPAGWVRADHSQPGSHEVPDRAGKGEADNGPDVRGATGNSTILHFPGRNPPLGQSSDHPPTKRGWERTRSYLGPAARLLYRPLTYPRVWKAAAITALGAAGAAVILPPVIAYSSSSRVTEELAPLAASRTAIWVRDSEGSPLGILPQNGELNTAAGIRSPQGNADFSQALRFLETKSDYFGISPLHLVRSVGCASWHTLWRGQREAEARCPGGSTLLMQVSTQLRGGKAGRGAIGRKWTEIRDALALSVTLPSGYTSEDRFVADNLPFGTAGGRTIVGIESASLIVFGRAANELSLAQAAILAAMPKRQLALYCVQPSSETLNNLRARWGAIRQRAAYALNGAFATDPRLPRALAEVGAMPDQILPASLASQLTQGMTQETACAAALDPVRRTELTDSSIRTLVSSEIRTLARPNGLPITEIQLATTIASQREFKTHIEAALHSVETSQRGRWLRPLLPNAGSADVLAFTANSSGVLTSFYVSNGRGLALQQRRLGSQSKLAALLAFAAAGLGPDSILCNRAWNGLRNANGDLGSRDCSDPGARVTVRTAFARSMNLPILDGLRRINPAVVARAAHDAGFTDAGGDLNYAIAFGVAESTPLRVAATTAALSRGISGQPALARVPHAISRYRVNDQWLEPPADWVDLRHYFASERARNLIAAAGGAPLRDDDGTLRSIAATDLHSGEVGKSGTDARAGNLTFAKTAVGAWAGRSWFTMVAADRGPVGRPGINIYQLAATTRRRSIT